MTNCFKKDCKDCPEFSECEKFQKEAELEAQDIESSENVILPV